MDNKGWIKLHRSILDWDWYKDTNTKIVFLHLLLMANYEDGYFKGQLIRRGQRFTSVGHIANELHISPKAVRIAIDKLKRTREVASKGTNKGAIITICNYEYYQNIENQQGEQQGEQQGKKGAGKGQQYKKDKNENNRKKKEFIAPTLDEVKIYFTENGYTEQAAEKAFNFYSVADWHDSAGRKVKNWKQKMQGVWFKEENEISKKSQSAITDKISEIQYDTNQKSFH